MEGTQSRSFSIFPTQKRIASWRIPPKFTQIKGHRNAFVSIKAASQPKFPPKATEAEKPSFNFFLHFIDVFYVPECLSTSEVIARWGKEEARKNAGLSHVL